MRHKFRFEAILHGTLFAVGSLLVAAVSPVLSAATTPTLDSTVLDGANGFYLDAVSAVDQAGWSVDGAGDLNNDGVDDFVVGAPSANPLRAQFGSGQAYIVFGRATDEGFPNPLRLADLNGQNGFTINGLPLYDGDMPTIWFGHAVSRAGDLNDDGIDDLVVSAPHAPYATSSGYMTMRGQIYVIFGRDTAVQGPFPAGLEASMLDGRNGFVLKGAEAGDMSGYSVDSAGDWNHDGIDDLIIGTLFYHDNYILFGRDTATQGDFPALLNLANINGVNGLSLRGPEGGAVGTGGGYSVSGAGDINGDGIDDVLLGTQHGSCFAIFGRPVATEVAAVIELSELDGTDGLHWQGVERCLVSAAGDFNADGTDDVLLADEGRAAFVYFGKNTPFPATVDLTQLDGRNGLRLSDVDNRDFPRSISPAGDFNDDGIADIVLGGDPSYLLFGRNTGVAGDFAAELTLTGLDKTQGLAVVGPDRSVFGRSVGHAGDINHDGIADIIIGAPSQTTTTPAADTDTGFSQGRSHVVFGRSSDGAEIVPPTVELLDLGNQLLAVVIGRHDSESTVVQVRDAVSRDIVKQFELRSFDLISSTLVSDLDGNDTAAIVLLGRDPGTLQLRAEVMDAQSGLRRNFLVYNSTFEPALISAVSDLNDNGTDDLILLVRRKDGTNRLDAIVKDGRTEDWLGTFSFNPAYEPIDMQVIPDLNGNGRPELALLVEAGSPEGADKIEIRDLGDGRLVRNIWFDRVYQPRQMVRLRDLNGNGAAELAISMTGSVKVEVRDTRSGDVLKHLWFNPQYEPLALASRPDATASGAPELALLGEYVGGDLLRAMVKDSLTANFVSNIWFEPGYEVHDLISIADLNGNGVAEWVLLGTLEGERRLVVRDGLSGSFIHSMGLP